VWQSTARIIIADATAAVATLRSLGRQVDKVSKRLLVSQVQYLRHADDGADIADILCAIVGEPRVHDEPMVKLDYVLCCQIFCFECLVVQSVDEAVRSRIAAIQSIEKEAKQVKLSGISTDRLDEKVAQAVKACEQGNYALFLQMDGARLFENQSDQPADQKERLQTSHSALHKLIEPVAKLAKASVALAWHTVEVMKAAQAKAGEGDVDSTPSIATSSPNTTDVSRQSKVNNTLRRSRPLTVRVLRSHTVLTPRVQGCRRVATVLNGAALIPLRRITTDVKDHLIRTKF